MYHCQQVVPNAGHSANEPGIAAELVTANESYWEAEKYHQEEWTLKGLAQHTSEDKKQASCLMFLDDDIWEN